MKKIFTLLLAALFLLTIPAQAQTPATVNNEDEVADEVGKSAEKFYASLPVAKGDYKSRQRPIVIQGAMNAETEILVRALKNPVAYRDLNYLFVAGTYKGYPVVVARTEQGMANAAVSTALALKKFRPVAVINQGTAGSYLPDLKIGSIVIGSKAIPLFAIKTAYTKQGEGTDLTNQEIRGTYTYDVATGNFQPYKEYPFDSTLFNIAFAVANKHENFNAMSGTIATSDAWLNTVDYANFLHEKYGALCEEMETVAAAQICENVDVPFIGIRIISDNVTTGVEYNPLVANDCQEFVLLVVEEYIRAILKQ